MGGGGRELGEKREEWEGGGVKVSVSEYSSSSTTSPLYTPASNLNSRSVRQV